MGASESVTLQMNFSRSSHFYLPGEPVSGSVLLQNDRDSLKLEEIFVELVGELGYSTSETRSSTDSNGNTTTEHYTDYHHLPFLTLRVPLAQLDFKQDKIILTRGAYTWPFEFNLPTDLPPSSGPKPQSYPHIKYYTRVVLDRPWYKPNVTQTHFLTISPRMDLLHMNGIQEMLPFAGQNRKQLRLQGCLLHGGIIPGQSLSCQIHLHNPERTRIKSIGATLIQHRQTGADQHHETICSINLPGLSEFNESHFQHHFDLPVPHMYLTPTHTFTTLSHGHAYHLKVHYELRLEVKSDGIFTKFAASVPVIVSTEVTSEEQQMQQNSGSIMPTSTNDSRAFDQTDIPPSYEMATKSQ